MTLFFAHIVLTWAAISYFLYYVFNSIKVSAARKEIVKEHGCLPPAKKIPTGDPVLNLSFQMENLRHAKKKRFLSAWWRRFQRYGNTVRFSVMGRSAIATIEPENIKCILATKFQDYGLGDRRHMALGYVLGEGIFTTDGPAWEHSRAMLRPNFVRTQVADLDMFEKHILDLIKVLPRDRSTIDMQEYFFKLTIDSATEFLFGESICSLLGAPHEGGDFGYAFNFCTERMVRANRLGGFYKLIPDVEYVKQRQIVRGFAATYVRKALEYRRLHDLGKVPSDSTKDGRYIFLYELAKETTDPVRLRDEILNILLAGRDTTASLLSNMFFEVAKQPKIWAKLRTEVDALNGQRPTFETLKEMKYLKACLNESLRLHPVVPWNDRTAIRDTVLPTGGGPDGRSPVFCPKGTMVAYLTYSMHRRPDFYGRDAEVFRPERWETIRPGWEYLPFNGGPRICIGQQFALTEAGYTTVRLMQEFDSLESRDTRPWCEWLTLTCGSGNGTLVSLTPFEK